MSAAAPGMGEQTARRLLTHLARAQGEGRVPALVAGVVRDGSLAWCEGRGAVPGDPADTQFRIGSITKTFTAVLLLQLVEEDTLTLDLRVRDVLGEVAPGPHGPGDRTLGELLSHTAGVAAEPAGDWWERAGVGDFADLAGRTAGADAAQEARGRHHYSNLAYGLLGEVVARTRGQDWWTCVRQRLLQPLGMVRTTYEPVAPFAQGYSVHPWTSQLLPEPHSDTGAMAPAGQLWSTPGDLTRWVRSWQTGHPEVLPEHVLREAFVPRAGDPDTGLAGGHGLGFQLVSGGSGTLVGHSGSMPGFQALLQLDPRRGTAALALGNATEGMPRTLAVDLLDELERSEPALTPAWRPPAPPPTAVLPVLGVWYWGARVVTLVWEDGAVLARSAGRELWRFVPDQDDTLRGVRGHHTGEALTVVRDRAGEVSHLEVGSFVLTRAVYDPGAPIPGGAPD